MLKLIAFFAATGLGVAAFAAAASDEGQGAPAPQQPPPPAQYSADLKVGDAAPDFALQGSDGRVHKLSEYRGRPVVLAWFPKAFTGGWTAQCNSLRDSETGLKAFDIVYFMASVDDPETNKRFAAEHGGDFPILSDPSKETARAYGTIRTDRPPAQQAAARFTFYIGPDGRILAIDKGPRGTGVSPATAGADMIRTLEQLGVPRKKG